MSPLDDPRASIFDPEDDRWDRVATHVCGLEREAFGVGAFSAAYLHGEFVSTANTVSLLVARDAVVGFSIASPMEIFDPVRERDTDTAYISDTVISAGWRGKGLIRLMMQELERELCRRGFLFMERDAAVASGYAASIERAYGERIVRQRGPRDSEWGLQMWFRIQL
jgi:GNAT superfamily N-acetyltransferase